MINILIIGTTALVSFMCFSNHDLFYKLAFKPYSMKGNRQEFYRFISHGLVHADIPHLAFNMFSLYIFGQYVVGNIMGSSEYLIFYISSLIVSSIPSYIKHKNNPRYLSIGASGAVSSVIFSLVLLEPWSTISLYFAIPIPFIVYAIGYIWYSAYMAKQGKDNIGHDAHLWGALYGIFYMVLMHPSVIKIFIENIQHPRFNF